MTEKQWTPEEIKALRRKYRINQAVLAKLVGVRGQQAISEWESGAHKPSRLCKTALARAEETLFILFDREAKRDHSAFQALLLHRYGVETKVPPKFFAARDKDVRKQ